MTKDKPNPPNEQTQEDIYLRLTQLITRTDVASNSFLLSSVAMQCDEKLLDEFLNDVPSPSNKSLKEFLQTHLYTAAFWGFCDIIKELIGYGADINYKNKGTLWTPLHAACFQEQEKAVELLLRHGASIRSKDKVGRTPIDIASVAQRVWPYFQRLKCEKSFESDLIRKGLLRGEDSTGTKTASPNSSRHSSSSTQMRALLGGDVESTNSVTPEKLMSKLQIK